MREIVCEVMYSLTLKGNFYINVNLKYCYKSIFSKLPVQAIVICQWTMKPNVKYTTFLYAQSTN